MSATAIIVAAGEGRRVGRETPKPFLTLADRPMLLRTLDRFFTAATIREVVVVVAADRLRHAEWLLSRDAAIQQKRWILQEGGRTRQESVRAGLKGASDDADVITIHDGARPFVSPALIDRSVETAREKGAVVVGLPVRDTIKLVGEDRWIESTPPRHHLWEIQTPQAFRRELIVEAHQWAAREGVQATDDAMLVERWGARVFVLDGERTNIKITVPDDLWLAEVLLRYGRVS